MNQILNINQHNILSKKFKTRCGYPVSMIYFDQYENIIHGTVEITLPNNSIFELETAWNTNGSNILKEKYPTYHYYDLNEII